MRNLTPMNSYLVGLLSKEVIAVGVPHVSLESQLSLRSVAKPLDAVSAAHGNLGARRN